MSCLLARAAGAQSPGERGDEGLWAEPIDGKRWAMGRDVLLALAAEAIAGGFELGPATDGVVVRRMPAAAWASALDIRVGDRLVLVNGVVPRDRASVRAAFAALHEAGWLELSLVRFGRRLDRLYLYDSPITAPRPPAAETAAIVAALAGATRVDRDGRRTIERGALELVGRHGNAFRDQGSGRSVDPLRQLLGLTRFDELVSIAGTTLELGDQRAPSILAEQAGAREFEVVVSRLHRQTTLRYEVVRARPRRALRSALEGWSRLATADHVVQRSDTEFEVERSFALELRSNPMAVIDRGARIVPSVKNGRPNGFKLYAIRPTSMLAGLGLRNGDTVEAVAGHKLGGFDDLPGAGDAVDKALRGKGAATIAIDIVRRGQPVRILYRVKPATKAK